MTQDDNGIWNNGFQPTNADDSAANAADNLGGVGVGGADAPADKPVSEPFNDHAGGDYAGENHGGDQSAAGESEPTPDYASAAGQTTVVSGAPAQTSSFDSPGQTQSGQTAQSAGQQWSQSVPQYRPAPEFGAYGPVPGQSASAPQWQTQQTQSFGRPEDADAGRGADASRDRRGRDPFNNPFLAGQQSRGQGQGDGGTNGFGGGNGNGNGFAGSGPAYPQGQPYQQPPRPAPQYGAYGPAPQNVPPNGPQYGPQNGQPGGGLGGNGFGVPGGPGVPGGAPDGGRPDGAQSRPRTAGNIIVAVVTAIVTAALCLGVMFAGINAGWVKVPTTSSLTGINSNKSGTGTAKAQAGKAVDWTAVAKEVSDSVVAIQTQVDNGIAKGSGAILDKEGHVITNNHVISGARQIQVTLANGTVYSAQVVGSDTTTDLAVIKLDNAPKDLKPVTFADSDKLAVGENVMAIGNPLGYDDTATTGIVSALNRPVTVMDDSGNDVVTNAVQLDAAINPGNSGGPTFNAAGQVIGINSSIASTATSNETAGSIGIGFAIPSNLVKRVADEIIKDGSATHVALGVTVKSATTEADGVSRGGAQVTTPSTGGSAVVSGGPAAKAGIKANDTIVAFNGNAVNNMYSLLGYVRAAKLGDKVTLTIVRDGKTMDVDVTLDQKEEAVNGTNRSDNLRSRNGKNNNKNQNGNGQNGDGQNDGQSDGQNGDGQGDGDNGGFDPFDLW